METEMRHIQTQSSLRFENNQLEVVKSPPLAYNDDHKYTSLKDIIPYSPSSSTSTNCYYEGNTFDSSNISIKNQLVKQAASAYLQSTAVLTSKDQHWLIGLWRKVNNKAALQCWWRIYIRNPLHACARHIFRFLTHMVYQIGGVWGGRPPIEPKDCE